MGNDDGANGFGEWESFAKKLAGKFQATGLEIEDLEQEALVALLEELPKYNEDLGVSLRVFLGRGIRNRLSSLYRKTLNLVQIDQYWRVKHASGNRELDVRAKSRIEGEAVMSARPDEYTAVENVKTFASLGPSLDEEIAGDDSEVTLHEVFGERPLQELELLAGEETKRVRADLACIFRLRNEGHTFDEIGVAIGKDGDAVRKAFSRAQKRLKKRAA